jgi:hypothetical protein
MRTTLDCAAVIGRFRLLTLYRRVVGECDAEPEIGVAVAMGRTLDFA